MKIRRFGWLMFFVFCFTIVANPFIYTPAAQAADTATIVAELQQIYPYVDEADKPFIRSARTNLETMSSVANRDNATYKPQWDAVLAVADPNKTLLTPQVIAKFSSAEEARNTLIDFAFLVGQTYYSTDAATLTNTLNSFEAQYQGQFQTLFGSDFTKDELFTLLLNTKANLPAALQGETQWQSNLAFGTVNELQTTMPLVLHKAMELALTSTDTKFAGRLTALGLSSQKLIDQQKVLADCIDTNQKGQLALAMAAVRSQTKLAAGMPTTVNAGDVIPHTITIMGNDATDLVEWQSSAPGIVEITEDQQTGNYILTAKAAGTATITAYRDVDPAPASAGDWVYRYDVTVEGGNLSASGYVKLQMSKISSVTGGVTINVLNNLDQVVTSSVVTTDDGYFELSGIPDGTYTISISANSHLARTIPNITIVSGTPLVIANSAAPISLWAGDLDGNKLVNATDLSVVLGSFNKILGDSGYNAGADLNGDNAVNASDLSILLGNFNKTSNSYPTWTLP